MGGIGERETNRTDGRLIVDSLDQRTLFDLAIWIWDQRLNFLFAALVGGVVSIGASFLSPRVYTARVTLLPSSVQGGSGSLLGDLASIAGASQPVVSYEPVFSEIIQSRSVLAPLLGRRWRSANGDSVTVYELLGLRADLNDSLSERKLRSRALRYLTEKAISIRRERLTGYMEMRVELPRDRVIPAAFANAIISALEARLVADYKSISQRRLEFLDKRFAAATDSVAAYEERLAQFEAQNRLFNQSPHLRAKHRQLSRTLSVHTTRWLELQRQLEGLSFQLASAQPTVLVLDAATAPLRPTRPKRVLVGVVGMVLGMGALGMFLAVRLLRAMTARLSLSDDRGVQ